MESISPAKAARRILAACLEGNDWPREWAEALARQALDADEYLSLAASQALFAGLVEPMADRFEPALCDAYARLFSVVLATAIPGFDAGGLERRYREVRRVRPVAFEPSRVFVLSRVTLGADVAITSIILDAARLRFPNAEMVLCGSEKAWALFETDSRLKFLPLPYGRTARLADRLSLWPGILDSLSAPGSLVLDPDSRLTQLGLLPVCDAERHHLFESRAYGGDGNESLPELTRRWVRETLGVDDAQAYLAPRLQPSFGDQPYISVSLGVGENPAKRLPDPFEAELLRMLAESGLLVVADLGAGGEESERVRRAAGDRVALHEGSFASFASLIARSRLYAGYDSAGQHVAGALGVPLVSIFRGAVNDRFFHRWSPDGMVLRADGWTPEEALASVRAALPSLLA